MSFGATVFNRLTPRVPPIQLSFDLPTLSVPLIGCFSGDGKTYIGKKWGNRADFLKLNHLKQKKKELEEWIITKTTGQLDNPPRKLGFIEEIARHTDEIAEVVADINELVGNITEEINAAVQFVNSRKVELTQAKAELLDIAEGVRSKSQQRLLEKYEDYFGKMDAQIGRLNNVKSCLWIMS